MRVFVAFISLAIALFLVPDIAKADMQGAGASRIDRAAPGLTQRHLPKNSDSPRAAINIYLRCSASLNRSEGLEVIRLPFGSAEQVASVNNFLPKYILSDPLQADCFSSFGSLEISYDEMTAVGAIAEFFITERYKEKDVAAISTLTKEDWKQSDFVPRNASEAFGMCVVQAQPSSIFALVEAEPESRREVAAFESLVPLLGPCLSDGQEISFDKTFLRSTLVFGLYHILAQSHKVRKPISVVSSANQPAETDK